MIPSYVPIHLYTISQILLTIGIFIVTLTIAGPAFPLLIILLVPLRLVGLIRVWDREVLRFVDCWACREGTPEGDEDVKRMRSLRVQREGEAVGGDLGAGITVVGGCDERESAV